MGDTLVTKKAPITDTHPIVEKMGLAIADFLVVNPAPCSSRVSIKVSMEKTSKNRAKWVFRPKMASQTLTQKTFPNNRETPTIAGLLQVQSLQELR